jgi:hypothetical protein
MFSWMLELLVLVLLAVQKLFKIHARMICSLRINLAFLRLAMQAAQAMLDSAERHGAQRAAAHV